MGGLRQHLGSVTVAHAPPSGPTCGDSTASCPGCVWAPWTWLGGALALKWPSHPLGLLAPDLGGRWRSAWRTEARQTAGSGGTDLRRVLASVLATRASRRRHDDVIRVARCCRTRCAAPWRGQLCRRTACWWRACALQTRRRRPRMRRRRLQPQRRPSCLRALLRRLSGRLTPACGSSWT